MDIVNLPDLAAAGSADAVEQRSRQRTQRQQRQQRKETSTALQYLRFCLVGVSNAVVDLGALNLLLHFYPTHSDLTLVIYNTIAVMLAILNSYLWNTRWTFHDEATISRRERALFVAQALLNIAINNVVLFSMTHWLPTETGEWSILTANLAKLAAMVAASTISFLLLRSVVFHSRAA